VYADEFPELPQLPAIPALASVPCLPSVYAFGDPKPPDIFDDAQVKMPDMEFWEEKLIAKKDDRKDEKKTEKTTEKKIERKILPQPFRITPIEPLYAASLAWPVRGRITSGYGPRGNRMHQGVDIPVPNGTPVQAAAAGVVAEARTYRGYGHTVIIDHENGAKTLYAHCSNLLVKKWERVESGQVIAYAGSTGRATTSHVHFEVIINGAHHNPAAYLREPVQLANKPQ